ncbi:hypothetical protein [Empedobacter sp.]|uniref:hypothetical protein n=1 Tax=Empedobacter sp. TaxID=1927715 RepID=UPI0028AC7D14|nr:hypothetical protein [Empedobacter sp.]
MTVLAVASVFLVVVVLATFVFVSFFSEATFLSLTVLAVASVFLVVVAFTSFFVSVTFLSVVAFVFAISVLAVLVGILV